MYNTFLSVLFNLTIQQNVIPAGWKKAKLTLLRKSGAKDDPRNCWHILVLPVVSKVLERLIHKQLADYFDEHILLCKAQSGFRMHSMRQLSPIWLMRFSLILVQGLVTRSVFIDLAKAFNTFKHDILICILKYFGVFHHGLSQGIVYLSYKTEILIIKVPIMAFPAKS